MQRRKVAATPQLGFGRQIRGGAFEWLDSSRQGSLWPALSFTKLKGPLFHRMRPVATFGLPASVSERIDGEVSRGPCSRRRALHIVEGYTCAKRIQAGESSILGKGIA